jgi:dienelactone hydrolase
LDAFDRSPTNGVRLALTTDSDSVIARLAGRIDRQPPFDFNKVTPVSDATFAGIRRMYDYDAKPLETKLESEGETQELRWQKVSFTAAYDGPRMAAYLFFPKNVSPPFEPVIVWGAANALTSRRLDPTDRVFDISVGFLARSGRMLVVPLYSGTYERGDSVFTGSRWRPDTTTRYRDQVVKQVKDLRRTIDFLETRSDIRSDRVGFHGGSWGGMMAPYALSIEPRIKAAVLYSAGFASYKTRQEMEAYNYSPRVHTPTLMENGRFDTLYPYETSQLPFLRLLGTPARDKKLVSGSTGHIVPMEQVVPETLAWFDKYLSGKTDRIASR